MFITFYILLVILDIVLPDDSLDDPEASHHDMTLLPDDSTDNHPGASDSDNVGFKKGEVF